MRKTRILGLSASLRAARWKDTGKNLVQELAEVSNREKLDEFITDQAKIHLDQFIESGRRDGKAFDELYKDLRKKGGFRGLSNSEVMLVAALWGARELGADIEYLALSKYFPANGIAENIDELKSKLKLIDGLLISTPVYFGDRSSLSQQLIELIRSDNQLRADMEGKIYAGLSVGAKRNGGQETTLIYQMLDMINIGFLGVGNDSDTTSQYGGTAHAGDVGTIPKDIYGINTAIGTGKRIAKVARLNLMADQCELKDRLKIGLWILQDRNNEIVNLIGKSIHSLNPATETVQINLLTNNIRPCIACDVCPTHIGPDEEYRCIIKSNNDGLKNVHKELLWADILVPALYSPKNRKDLVSVYQQFMERTRYLRRGDYVFSDQLVVPLIFSDIDSHENLHIRTMTSFIRHHTIMYKPIIGWLKNGKLLNGEEVESELNKACSLGYRLTSGRLMNASVDADATSYRPVGYVLSQEKDNEDESILARKSAIQERNENIVNESRKRLLKN